jgi:hypothetical protein
LALANTKNRARNRFLIFIVTILAQQEIMHL